MGQRRALILHHEREQIELLGGKVDLRSGAPQDAAVQIHGQGAGLKNRKLLRLQRAGAAQNGPQPARSARAGGKAW